MKKILLFFAAVMTGGFLFAQAPLNDDCSGVIDLGFAPTCPTTIFSNVGATPSNIGLENIPSCFSNVAAPHDVWFSFNCPDTLFDFRMTLTAAGNNPIQNPEFAVYRGDCTLDGLAELLCKKGMPGDTSLVLDLSGLTPGATYFIRISDYAGGAGNNAGEFTLCVDKIPPINFINDGGSSLCEGTLYDTGGPTGDYGIDENFAFVICPNDQPKCITFTLDYYNIESGSNNFTADALRFYDGNSINAPLITALEGGGFGDPPPAGGGGVTFQVQATSGCLTVQFVSDDNVNFEGWQGNWKCSQQACPQPETITFDTVITKADIVNAVGTPATTVTVTDIKCPPGAYGTFSFPTDKNDLGLKQGLVLTSGQASYAKGPNDSPGGFQYDNNAPGDPDLDYLSNDPLQESNDACVVELDVFAATDELSFEYVFGSEEYPEYVETINDIFAFFVSGPGIVGDPNLTNSAKNIALIPGTNLPVEIQSVNNLLNWQFYRTNELGTALQYDGLTSDKLGIKKTLTARTSVIPCNTYHLKLAVADRADGIFDSGVFVSEIQGGTPDLKVQFASGIDYLTESCSGTNDQLVISLSQPLDKPISFTTTVGGSAILGVDYTLTIPTVITFQAGETQLFFPIVPLSDNLVEGTEKITVSLSNNFGCGTVVYKVLTIDLKDNIEVQVQGGDTLLVCAGSTFQLQASGAGAYVWAPASAVSNPFIPNPTTKPTQNQWLVVTGTLNGCTDIDSVYLKIISPSIDVVALADTNICLGGKTVPLKANNNTGGQGITWSPTAGLDVSTGAQVIAKPTTTTTYTATLNIAGCIVKDQITINVDTLFFPTFKVTDTTVCQHYPVQLADVIKNSTKYQWNPAAGLSDATSSGPIALPNATTVYTLTATSANGNCTQTATAKVNVIAADVNITGDAYREICLGDTLNLTATSAPSGAVINWSPSFYLSASTGNNVKAFPDESITVKVVYNINNCVVFDSVRIRVDSLPLSKITRSPDKTIYCPGDTVFLISKTYEPSSFPDINPNWQPGNGQITPLEKWNMVINATVTDTFIRETKNHACFVRDTAIIPVAIPPTFMFTLTPPSICPGETTQIVLTTTPPGIAVEWEASSSLSCTKCLNPIANPVTTTTYQVKATGLPCPAGANVTVPVKPTPVLDLIPSQTICFGKTIVLNGLPAQPGVTYTWTSDPVGQPLDGAQPTVTPGVTTTYTVVATGPGFCTNTASTIITVAPQTFVNATFTPDHICPGETVQLNSTVVPAGTAILWSGPNLSCTTCASPTATPTDTAIYVLTTPNNTCPSESTVKVPVWPVPKLNVIADQAICLGDSIKLNTAPPDPKVVYVWTTAAGAFVSNAAQPTVKPFTATTYKLSAEGVNICKVEKSVTITVASASIDLGPDRQTCAGVAIPLTATVTGTQGGTFTWLPGNLNGNPVTVTPTQPTTYSALYAYGPNNTCFAVDTVKLSIAAPANIVSFTASPEGSLICLGSPITIRVVTIPVTATLAWTENGVLLPALTQDSVRIVPSTDGSVTIGVTASNTAGCIDTASVTYQVKRCFEMPNAFSPNGDNINNTFGPLFFGAETTVVSFKIFNRWGEKVFDGSAGKPSWDGKVDGKEAPSDVFAYQIIVRYTNGQEEERKGQVTLLR
jgi:gliding motility-associated-like protein